MRKKIIAQKLQAEFFANLLSIDGLPSVATRGSGQKNFHRFPVLRWASFVVDMRKDGLPAVVSRG